MVGCIFEIPHVGGCILHIASNQNGGCILNGLTIRRVQFVLKINIEGCQSGV